MTTVVTVGDTWRDMVRRVAQQAGWPEPSDEEAVGLLVNETSFPFGSAEEIEDQLRGALSREVNDDLSR